MNAIKYLSCIICLIITISTQPQDQSILIFDPNDVSTSFQSTLSQLTEDSVFVADTLDDSIFSYDALFLFIEYPYELSQTEGNKLIAYTAASKPTYIYSGTFPIGLDTIAFWNHIGVDSWAGLLLSVPIDIVFGPTGEFTEGVVIDTSFMSGLIPVVYGNVDSVLIGDADTWEVNTTFKSGYDSLNVIIDLYNLIDDYGFLERVLQKFGLISPPHNVQINFFPSVDTALANGGCTIPELICRNLTSTNYRDSISIEPGFNTNFYYFDSSGYQIPIDNYYFLVIDSLDEYDYEVWFHPKSYPPFEPALIEFDTIFYSDQNNFDIQLIVKKNGIRIDSLSQPFHADFGLELETSDRIPSQFELYQNYPNPFNPSTKIKFSIPSVGTRDRVSVQLKVYDVLGNEIATLVNEEKQPGAYEIEFNGTSLPSGIYFYQLKAGNFVQTKKMTLMK